MELLLIRKYKNKEYTIGKLYVSGEYFCDTLEDAVRDLRKDGSGKIRGITAIPSGKYVVTMTYSPRFKRVLPLLNGVPFFEGVRIHRGNTAKDTEGCILVGKNLKKGMVLQSTQYEQLLCEILLAANAAGDSVLLTIKD